ncbi:MAG: hypothetical protein KAX38_02805 [Candidatus Krumholzibacteria bacterium]|nr:hypothetical protein [Candidatus Krumholzibacteria bacterium]
MRILICFPWLSLGGAPNSAITLAKGLKERGHDVFFFTKIGSLRYAVEAVKMLALRDREVMLAIA